MILDSDLPELGAYRRLERELPLLGVPELGRRVVSGDNELLPVHRWFKYKEAYSPALLWDVLTLLDVTIDKSASLLDPFCGVGTTMVSVQLSTSHISSALGIERNPFAAFVARTKLSWPHVDIEEFDYIAGAVLSDPAAMSCELPALSSISTGRCISKHIAGKLVGLRDAIAAFSDSRARDVLLLGLASVVEPLSHTRKDGRALRIVERPARHVVAALRHKWDAIRCDLLQMHALSPPLANVIVKEGDGRDLQDIGLRDKSIDIVFTSPPYPNNIDYSEVYKLELWLLGFIESSEQFLQLRKSTLRSHPSSDLAKGPNAEFMQAIGTSPLKRWFDPMISRTASFTQRWRTTLVLSYFSDLWTSLKEQFRCLKEGGRAFLVVANSLHGNSGNAYLIPTDLLVGQLGSALGFELERILVARNTRRRLSGNHFLRESVVVLRKPYGTNKRAAL